VGTGAAHLQAAAAAADLPEGIALDGNRFNRTAATAQLFNYLAPSESADEKMVTQIFTSWNPLASWLQRVDALRRAG
jgi:hypothetical protein